MADFELKPDFVLETTPNYSTLITKFENGVEQRRPRRENSLTEFHLYFKNRTQDDMSTILGMFNIYKGAFQSFTWLNPEDGQTYNVRFKDDSFTKQLKMFGIWDFDFSLVVVL